ncbi:hypothetical protein [Rhodococcus sp. G-MC3]|uniref:hypothetical protein n=1 Tax=Rhodococcus sp. G-MC3 TaxID=3046209 RepID=UPI0030143EA9
MTSSEAAVLLVLMAEARAVSNSELAVLGPKLEKPSRDKLVRMGLVEIDSSDRPISVELTDKGWKYCGDLIGADPLVRSTGSDRALFTVLAGFRRWLDRSDVRPSEIFIPRAKVPMDTVSAGPGNIESRIRAAYARLAREPGTPVRLSRLRPELSDVPRAELDSALARLRRAPDVSLIPEENQKTLTDDDRAAAVLVGNQHNHLLAIES